MKKTVLTLGLALAFLGTTQAQIFLENFEAVPLTSGTGSVPAGWTLHNVDNLSPATNVNFMGSDAWKVRSVNGTKAAVSTSWYTPAGTSNDWMVTPSISVPASGNIFLRFKEFAPDPSFPDGYKVYISTTGNSVADFTNPAVLSVPASNSTAFTTKLVNLSSFLGQNIYIAFRNDNQDKFLLYIDDVEVLDLPANDAKLNALSLPRYGLINTNSNLVMNVTNMGSQTITSLEVDWNDGTAHSAVISGLNITHGDSANVTHSVPVNYAAVEEKTINVTITQVNAAADANPGDNALSTLFNSTSSTPKRSVLIEEGTGTWCGWCPRGTIAMEYMYNTYQSQGFIGIAVHNGDPMAVSAYDNAANFGGYPSCNVDRVILDASVSQGNFEIFFNARKNLPVPVGITANAGVSGTTLTVNVNANFVTKFANSNFRIAAVVVENGVTGTSSGYAQTNYYAGGANGPMGGYESKPDPVPANQMVYDHVGRALLGGYLGEAGSVPGVINDGTTASHTFTYTVPSSMVVQNLSVVAMVIDQSTGEVVNSVETGAGYVSTEEVENNLEFSVYPNPTTDVLNVNLNSLSNAKSLQVYDMNGKMVYNQDLSAHSSLITVPVSSLKSGNYMIYVKGEGHTHTKMFVKK